MRRTAELDVLGATPLDYAIDWIESGKTLRRLTDEMSDKTGHLFSLASVTRYLETLAPDAAQRIGAARRKGAHGLVDDAMEIVDATAKPGTTREEIASAKLRAEMRTWTAGHWGREDYGARPTTSVTLNVNALHIDALRRRATLPEPSVPLALPSSDAEDVTIEESAESGAD